MDSKGIKFFALDSWILNLVTTGALCLCYLGACNSSTDKIDNPEDVEQKILVASEHWMGTPYKLGGITKDGVDCSAFTQIIYKEAFRVDLPRRVKEQKTLGLDIPIEEMKPGDLVVFKTGVFFTNKQHIGIYLSDYNFIHASSSNGVTISSLKDKYWKKKYRSSRRLIDEYGKIQDDSQVATQ